MNRFVKGVVLFFVWVGIGFAQETRIRIAVFDLEALKGVDSSEAKVISEKLRTEIALYSKVFEVVDRSQMDKTIQEAKLQLTGLTESSEAEKIQLGKILNVKRGIIGTVSRFLGVYTLNVRLVDMETGRVLVSKSADAEEGELLDTIRRLAGEVSLEMRAQLVKISVDEISQEIAKGNYEKAQDLLMLYERQNGITATTKDLQKQIQEGMAKNFYTQAIKLYDAGDFEKARGVIKKAVSLVPENKSYQEYLRKVEQKIEQLQKEKVAKEEEERRRLLAEQRRREYWENRKKWDFRWTSLGLQFIYSTHTYDFVATNYPMLMGGGISFDLGLSRFFEFLSLLDIADGLRAVKFDDFFLLYHKFLYVGINNEMKYKPETLKSASIQEYFWVQGVKVHYLLGTVLDIGIGVGYNYYLLVENASDFNDLEVSLQYPMFGFHAMISPRIMLTEGLSVFAEVNFYANRYRSVDLSSWHFSVGFSYGF